MTALAVRRCVLARQVVAVRRHPVDAAGIVGIPHFAVLHGTADAPYLYPERRFDRQRAPCGNRFDLANDTKRRIGTAYEQRRSGRVDVARTEQIVTARADGRDPDRRSRTEFAFDTNA